MNNPSHEYCKECSDWNGSIGNCMEICSIPMNIIEEWEKYHAIGTPEKIKEELDHLRNDNDCQGLYFTLEERQDLARQHRELEKYKTIGTPEQCRVAVKFKEYFDELYGNGLEVVNWHQNGDTEPFDNFYKSALDGSDEK